MGCGENDRDPSEHLTVHGSFTVTFSKFPVEDSLGRPMAAAAFTTGDNKWAACGIFGSFLLHPEKVGMMGKLWSRWSAATCTVVGTQLCSLARLHHPFPAKVVQQMLPATESL